ncbi:hypothetical protein O6H91_Y550900 [Diphasiastrum complanatum]|nr:hypothetical protein O6H91_Y550900 [Diphasiastrum complanatum]
MTDYHFVYKDVEGTSTEWDDIQRRLGNLPPKPPVPRPEPWAPASDDDSSKDKQWMDTKTMEELEELEDDLDLDDDRFLEEYRVAECGILGRCFDELATKYPGTKFVKIVSTECIPNYPDFNLPTVLIYNNTNVKATLVGLHHFGGRRCTPEDVAFTLCQVGPVLIGSEDDDTSKSVTEKVRQDFLERILTKHEQDKSELSDNED